jgi:hypothetical protein
VLVLPLRYAPLPWRAQAAAAEHDIGEGRRHAQAAKPPSMARGSGSITIFIVISARS